MIFYIFAILLVFANCLSAQPATLTQVLASFSDYNGSHGTTMRLGSATDYYQLDYIAPPTQTVALDTTNFTPMSFGQIQVTRTGSPAPIWSLAFGTNLTLTYSSVQYGIQQVNFWLMAVPNGTLVIPVQYSNYFDLVGAYFSPTNDITVVDDAGTYPATVELVGRGTRGQTRLVNPVTMTMPQGGSAAVVVPIQTVGNLPFTGLYNGYTLTAPSATLEMVTIAVTLGANNYRLPGTYTIWASVRAPGVPDTYMPFTLVVTPSPTQISFHPGNLVFAYVKGSPEPPPVTFTVATSHAVYLTMGLYDGSWINVDFTSNSSYLSLAGAPRTFTITPHLANKNLGMHSTRIPFTSPDGTSYLNVQFYVADAPGSLKTSSLPAGGGTVEVGGAVVNGQPLTLTARAAPGYTFTRWSGTVASIDNPVTFVVNGTTNAVAEFSSANGSCTYTVSPVRISVPAGGDVGRVDVTTQANCAWSFGGLPSWMTAIGSASGTGAGALSYTVSANPGSAVRQATVLAGGATIAVEQAGSGCTTVSAASPGAFAAAGGNATIAIDGAANCVFVPVSMDTWLTSTSPDSFQNNSSVVATAAASTLTAPRTSALYLGGFRVPVLQKGTQFSTVFGDVPASYAFADYISVLERSGIADLCGTGFCPEAPTTRAQMAEFLVHSLLRTGDFPYPATAYFTDVRATHPSFRWIQKLSELGVTTGCGGGKYCPDDSVTRGQMATFLIRTRARVNATATFPFRGTPYFTDVAVGHSFFPFIQKLRDWGITAGCAANKFCPEDVVSRGQMAVFLVRGFLTP